MDRVHELVAQREQIAVLQSQLRAQKAESAVATQVAQIASQAQFEENRLLQDRIEFEEARNSEVEEQVSQLMAKVEENLQKVLDANVRCAAANEQALQAQERLQQEEARRRQVDALLNEERRRNAELSKANAELETECDLLREAGMDSIDEDGAVVSRREQTAPASFTSVNDPDSLAGASRRWPEPSSASSAGSSVRSGTHSLPSAARHEGSSGSTSSRPLVGALPLSSAPRIAMAQSDGNALGGAKRCLTSPLPSPETERPLPTPSAAAPPGTRASVPARRTKTAEVAATTSSTYRSLGTTTSIYQPRNPSSRRPGVAAQPALSETVMSRNSEDSEMDSLPPTEKENPRDGASATDGKLPLRSPRKPMGLQSQHSATRRTLGLRMDPAEGSPELSKPMREQSAPPMAPVSMSPATVFREMTAPAAALTGSNITPRGSTGRHHAR